MLREELKSITVDDLLNKNEISVRARKFCNNSNINSLFDIFDSYEKGRLFYEFKKAGTQICVELQGLCKKYDNIAQEIDLKEIKTEHLRNNNYISVNCSNSNTSKASDSTDVVKHFQHFQKSELKIINLELLRDNKILSERAANYCKTKRLDTLFKIISYYERKGTFSKNDIAYAGEITCIELDFLCRYLNSNDKIIELREKHCPNTYESKPSKKNELNIYTAEQSHAYLQAKELINRVGKVTTQKIQENESSDQIEKELFKEDLKEISLDELIDSFQISVRTRNCCYYADIHSLFDIVTCYNKHGMTFFQKMKGAGRKTLQELENLCKETLSNNKVERVKNKEPHGQFIRYEEVVRIIEKLSEREREILFSLSHLILLKETIIEEKAKIYGHYCFEPFVIDFFERNHYLPMFWILEKSITDNISLKTDILLNSFKFFNDRQTLSLEQLASKHSKSRDQIRKMRNDFFEEIYSFDYEKNLIKGKRLSFLKIAEIFEKICKDDFKYLLSELIDLDVTNHKSSEVYNLLKKEKCNFSIEFALQIITYIFPNNFVLFGGFEIPNYKNTWEYVYKKSTWTNIFLIKKDLTLFFDFEKMRESFSNLLNNNDTEYYLDIDDYVSNSDCWINFDFTKNEIIADVVQEILLFEFGLCPELDGGIKIPANKKCNPSEVVYKILQQNGKPMLLNDIFIEFKKIHPNHKYTEAAQLRSYLLNNDAITHRKRNSEYTLKEWKHIKTGTIRDAIVDFLDKKNLPQTINEISEYVLQYFPESNVSSVRTTMYSDSKKRFSFFDNNLFGLSSKEYPIEYRQIDKVGQVKTFEQRLNDFEQFIVNNERFPNYSTNDKEEKSLSAWWNRVKYGRIFLNETQQAEIQRVQNQYEHLIVDRKVFEWELNYNKLKIFLLENQRTPSAIGTERNLYDWLRKIKMDFQNDNLSDEHRKKFIELAKLI